MNAQSAGRRLVAVLVVAHFAACDDSTGPPPVSTVEVAGAAAPLKVGESAQLTATVRDAKGNELLDREVVWSSSDDRVASVDSTTGLVTGESAGAVMITATSEGAQGTADISVFAEVVLASISPAVLRAGEAATLTGEGFSTTLGANLVLVGGERAIVTEATPTRLEVLVSATACQVTADVDVQVTVDSPGNDESSKVLRHPFEAEGESFSLGVGELALIEATPDFCLRFRETSESEAYLIGLQSTAMSVATVTPAAVSAATSNDGAALARVEARDGGPIRGMSAAGRRLRLAPTSGSGTTVPTPIAERGRRWQRHRRAELSLRRQDVRLLERARPLAWSARPGGTLANVGARATAASSIAANVQVGDTLPIRVPKFDDVCAGFDSIGTVVRHVGDHAVWLEDVDNPAGGFTSNDFDQLNQAFEDRIYETNVENLGEPLDLDENDRITIVTTKEVNERENVLGFVSPADLFARTECPSSNFGELYYGRTPDPAGEFGDEYTLAEARLDAPQLIAHEFAHIIQFSGWMRIEANPPAPAIWNLEGQALIAEELNGHAATGRTTGQNYGFDVAWTGVPDEDEEQTEIAWYFGGFVDMFVYYGFKDRESSAPGAPEECSWLGNEDDGNDGPCESGREVYGVPWSLLRWLADQFGADIGGEAAFQRGLVKRGSSGFQAIAELVPVSRKRWLAEWAAALYVDDRVTGVDSRLTLPSWDLFDIESSIVETAHLRPRQRAFVGFSDDVNVRAGSTAYFCIGRAQQSGPVDCASAGTGRPETVVRARDALGGNLPSHMQLWVVRLE